MFSTPLIASSNGVATERATTSAFAPGYNAVTCTVGGAISGNKVMGRVYNDNNPNNTRIIDTTVESTGRSMKRFNSMSKNILDYQPQRGRTLNKLSNDIGFGLITAPSCKRS